MPILLPEDNNQNSRNIATKEEWNANVDAIIAALRSGKYVQETHGKLFAAYTEASGNPVLGTCCAVGVIAIEVFGYALGMDEDSSRFQLEKTGKYPLYNYNGVHAPFIKYKGEDYHIEELNDRHRLSFNEIADLIEEQWKGE